jgi:glycosyltransferase involved in cell wall biosynthesis
MTLVDVVIPAYNEEEAIALVLADIPKERVRNIYVVDNNSTDQTAERARMAGAVVLSETQQGYGSACLRGLAEIKSKDPRPDVVVFLDADYSDHPEELPLLLQPIKDGKAELVIGSRALGAREKGAMLPQQVFGNWLATTMMRWMYGSKFTDLGPFRVITWRALEQIQMADRDFGWTVEMQVKVLKNKILYTEVPVSYRKRKGVSKITGTIRGTIMAGYKIIFTILRHA